MIDLNKYSEQFRAIADRPIPACFCGECDDPDRWEENLSDEPLRFECAGCKREMPWCFGADDHYSTLEGHTESLFDYCDDCAAVITKDREDDSWKDAARAVAEVFGVKNNE